MRLFLALITVTIVCTLCADDASLKALQNLTPENTVVAFDFHNVLVDLSYKGLYQQIDVDFGKKLLQALPRIIWQIPWWLPEVFRLKKQYPSSALFPKLAQRYTFFQPLVPKVIRMSNQQIVKPKGLEAVRQLYDNNYSLVLASNITQQAVADLRQNGSKDINRLIDYFNDFLIPNKENNLLHKPSIEYFNTLKNMFPTMSIVFFDDKFANRKVAQSVGILAFDPSKMEEVVGILVANASKLTETNPAII